MSADTFTDHRASAPAPAASGRLLGLDLARGLAVLGMFAAHVGPDPADGGPVAGAMQFTHGRASALFAMLAGVSLVLIAGRTPRVGRDGRQALARIVIRALVLLALGTVMTEIGTSVAVILAYYGVYFLLALPLTRLKAGPLAAAALAWALIGPQLSFVLRAGLQSLDWTELLTAHDPIAHYSGEGLLNLLLTGNYPALTWMPFVLAGMALGRIDLSSAAVRARLAVAGAALAAVGYGGSWLACQLAPTEEQLDWWHGPEEGTVATTHPAGLLTASPHSGTTFEVLGSLGIAVFTLVACTALLAQPSSGLRQAAAPLVAPVLAVGTVSLSVYVGHVALIGALGGDDMQGSPLVMLMLFAVLAMALARLWTRLFRRGPLEAVLHRATLLARYVR
ncbi:heparan-alpha-glucosaminide N-acetyltransferase domain-containing protein [Kitasatospora sp. GP82]|uniref:heparan-alpha-glucosaminide N-acetyltransferase domain-containing protein n=1 Tax=Kitasatospora sp. GP82 TaxID=3035089 RepID=UPI002474CB00|nr:heparan-alpha-glucosaminide N-acetyltransferase domain-containing protein [Kitasatospora sp. GP82]MDH6125062.1 putative membrane protein [Kitasatospora sp. GP82]